MTDQQPSQDHLTAEERRLTEALATEAEKLVPSSTALATIQRRISEAPTPLDLARARRHRRTGVVAGVVALSLAAAATLFAVNGGIQRQTTPDPAQTPTSSPSTADTQFDPNSPRTSWTVYREATIKGRPALVTEEVRATPPFEPRQSLAAMFDTLPLDPRAGDPNHQLTDPYELNTVASVELSDDAIEVDMTSVNPVKPYDTGDDAATARSWAQSWVRTIQEAYGTELPVRITRRGEPFTLFGFVGTATPITRDASLPVESAIGIFLPRANEEVTSPVALNAELPDGEQRFVVTDLATKRTVFDETAEDQSAGGIRYRPDLPQGHYELSIVVRSPDSAKPRVLSQYGLEFTVVGPDPDPVPPPVSNPATQPVTLAPVFFPAAKGSGLVEEQRALARPAGPLETVLHDGPSSTSALAGPLLPGSEVASVTGDADEVTVDFRDLGRNSAPSSEVRQRIEAIRRTAAASYGTDAVVRFTLDGRPTGLYGQPASDTTARPIDLPVAPAATYEAATADPLARVVIINGRAASPQSTVTWYLIDGIGRQTRFQGVATVDPVTLTYAFGITVPVGSYLVDLDQRTGNRSSRVRLEVTA